MDISNCCKAPIVVGGAGMTHYYVCEKCGQPCDMATYNRDEDSPTYITIVRQTRGIKVEWKTEMPRDADVYEWASWFKETLVALGFHPKSADEVSLVDPWFDDEDDDDATRPTE